MFKKHIIFQILYIIVHYSMPPASLKVPPSDKRQFPLIGQLAQCIVIGQTLQAASEM